MGASDDTPGVGPFRWCVHSTHSHDPHVGEPPERGPVAGLAKDVAKGVPKKMKMKKIKRKGKMEIKRKIKTKMIDEDD